MAAGELLYAILKQAINDYIKLDPDGDSVTADFYESEGEDYKTAESFIFGSQPIYFGSFVFTFDDLCELFSDRMIYSPNQIRRNIIDNSIEF